MTKIKDVTLYRVFRRFILDRYKNEFANRPALRDAVADFDNNAEETKGVLAVYTELMDAMQFTNDDDELLALVDEGMETIFEEIPNRFNESVGMKITLAEKKE